MKNINEKIRKAQELANQSSEKQLPTLPDFN
jgi:hypothetical protein